MLPDVAGRIKDLKFLINENSTTILTGVGIAGTITTAYLSGRASFKAARLLEEERYEAEAKEDDNGHAGAIVDLTLWSKVKIVWRLYIPPFLMGTTTVISIIAANKIASKKIAALAIASGISDRALKEYKEKVIERFGENKDRDIRDAVAQDRVENSHLSREVLAVGTGEVLCYDMHTGRYFSSTVEDIKRAENKINHELLNHAYASLSEFYDEIGLPPTSYSDNVGWNLNGQVEVKFSTVMSPDKRPCIAIDFNIPPSADYYKNLHES
jgi:hypothetical protein